MIEPVAHSHVNHLAFVFGVIGRLYAIRVALDYTHSEGRMTSPETFRASTLALRLANGA